jgi:hypothetical protein
LNASNHAAGAPRPAAAQAGEALHRLFLRRLER